MDVNVNVNVLRAGWGKARNANHGVFFSNNFHIWMRHSDAKT